MKLTKLLMLLLLILGADYVTSSSFNSAKASYEELVALKHLTPDHDMRSRRSVIDRLPELFDFELTVDRKPLQLRLRRSENVRLNIPIYVEHDGVVQKQVLPPRPHVEFYHDLKQGASVSIECEKGRIAKGHCKMTGSFVLEGKQYMIHPVTDAPGPPPSVNMTAPKSFSPEFPRDIAMHRVFVPADSRSISDFISDSVPVPKMSTLNKKRLRSGGRQKRQTETKRELKLELLCVVDYNIYKTWVELSPAADAVQKDLDAKTNIAHMYAHVVHAIDQPFQNIVDDEFAIRIVFAGLFIVDNEATNPPGVEFVKAQTLLTDFGTWVKSHIDSIPDLKYDHAMLFTGYNITLVGSPGVTGMSWTSGACLGLPYSVVEYKFDASIGLTGAHEIGHNLGVNGHDREGNRCDDEDYVMSTERNGWEFSTCSIESFRTFINKGDCAAVLETLADNYDEAAYEEYMDTNVGQTYNADLQCKLNFGAVSIACRDVAAKDSYMSVCNELFCYYDALTCQAITPWDGTTCGNGKWCERGQCVEDDRASTTVRDECPFGDAPIYAGYDMTWSELIAIYPEYCYDDPFDVLFCDACYNQHTGVEGCEYGDGWAGYCNYWGLNYCYLEWYNDYCCETCGTLAAAAAPLAITESAVTTPTVLVDNEPEQTEDEAPNDYTWPIAGVIAGGVVLIALACVLTVYRHMQRRTRAKEMPPPEIHVQPPIHEAHM